MTDVRPDELGETPVLEVTVYRNGRIIHRERCDSEDDAACVVTTWEEMVGVTCEVIDLSEAHHDESVLEIDLAATEEYRPG